MATTLTHCLFSSVRAGIRSVLFTNACQIWCSLLCFWPFFFSCGFCYFVFVFLFLKTGFLCAALVITCLYLPNTPRGIKGMHHHCQLTISVSVPLKTLSLQVFPSSKSMGRRGAGLNWFGFHGVSTVRKIKTHTPHTAIPLTEG